jgi:hypothetical protein
MRDYARVSPQFWTGDTGQQILALGSDAVVVALYLMTCPSANMIGLYYLPLPTLSHETRIPFEGASEALRSLSRIGFCYRDEATQTVWVPEMARFQIGLQIGEALKAGDNRIKGIARELEPYRKSTHYRRFIEKYVETFRLDSVGLKPSPSEAPLQGPSEPLRSQAQDQAQDQDQAQEQEVARASAPPPFDGRVLTNGQLRHPAMHVIGLWNAMAASNGLTVVPDQPASLSRVFDALRRVPSLDAWEACFGRVGRSNYLTGRTVGHNRRTFRADFWWVLTHYDEISAGRYDNDDAPPTTPGGANGHDRTPGPPTVDESRAFLARMQQRGAVRA